MNAANRHPLFWPPLAGFKNQVKQLVVGLIENADKMRFRRAGVVRYLDIG
jgi:hypothetical protein